MCDKETDKILDVIDTALAKAGYRLLDEDANSITFRNENYDYFKVTLSEEAQ